MNNALELILPPADLAAFIEDMRAGLGKDVHLAQHFSASAGVVVVGLVSGGTSTWFAAPADNPEAAQVAYATICSGINFMALHHAKQCLQASEIAGDVIKKAMH